jgi:hypothetical protein
MRLSGGYTSPPEALSRRRDRRTTTTATMTTPPEPANGSIEVFEFADEVLQKPDNENGEQENLECPVGNRCQEVGLSGYQSSLLFAAHSLRH